MGAHLVLFGPSTAGKTSLMLGLARHLDAEDGYEFNLDRTWTTRPRRPGEGDDENRFATTDEFEARRPHFLFPFQTFPTYEYGVERPGPLKPREVRMRILMPVFAAQFRSMVSEPTVLCAVMPYATNPEAEFLARDPGVDRDDLRARLARYEKDRVEAEAAADIRFQNKPGLEGAVTALRTTVVSHLVEREFVS